MPHVFVSHASQDAALAIEFATSLRERGYPVWASPTQLRPGTDWGRAIDDALTDAIAVLLLCTSAAVDSSYVRAEIEYALTTKKITIPIIVEQADLPIRWKALQWVVHAPPIASATVNKILDHLPELPHCTFERLLSSYRSFEELRSLLVHGKLSVLASDEEMFRDRVTELGVVDAINVTSPTLVSSREQSHEIWQFLPPTLMWGPDNKMIASTIAQAADCAIADFINRTENSNISLHSLNLNIVVGRRSDLDDQCITLREKIQKEINVRASRTGYRSKTVIMSYDRLLDMSKAAIK
jgi:hypothetical protein